METIVAKSKLFESDEKSSRLNFLESRSKEMEDSIRYAGRIQQSILPNENIFKSNFEDAFVLFGQRSCCH